MSKYVNIKHILDFSDYHDCNAGVEVNDFPIKLAYRSVKRSTERSIEKMKLVVT